MAILKTYSMKTMKPSKNIKYKPNLKVVGSGIKKAQPVKQPFKMGMKPMMPKMGAMSDREMKPWMKKMVTKRRLLAK